MQDGYFDMKNVKTDAEQRMESAQDERDLEVDTDYGTCPDCLKGELMCENGVWFCVDCGFTCSIGFLDNFIELVRQAGGSK